LPVQENVEHRAVGVLLEVAEVASHQRNAFGVDFSFVSV
jgi:hypothetical protein